MFYIIAACLLYTIAILLASFASRNADSAAVSLIANTVSVVAPLAVVVQKIAKKSLGGQSRGLWVAALTGLIIGAYVLALNKSYSVNKVGVVTPMVFGGAIFLSAVASYFLYKQKISLTEGIGLSLVLVGVLIIGYARATTG
jgi:multidrug transporter EmrE-like cation transporter